MKIVDDLKKIILEAVEKLDLSIIEEEIKIEHPADVNFGDYSTNIALILSKKVKKNPRELAEKIVNVISTEVKRNGEILEDDKRSLDFARDDKRQDQNDKRQIQYEDKKIRNDSFIEKVEVAGVGFINFYLKPEYLIKQAEVINYENEFRNKMNEYGNGKTMVIDYSAPNIAKPFGIGHLRSTNIGQSIYNIYGFLGWNCIGDNHIGDWGTQFGKLIVAIKKWNEKDLTELTIEDLEKLYVRFHKESEKDEKLIDEGRTWFEKLEKGDQEARDIWQKCIDTSLLEFDRVYQMLGVHIDNIHGESFYEKMLPEIIEEIKNQGITKESEGAIIVDLPDMPPAMLQKTNGTTTYFTRDMATIKYRLNTWNPDLVVYEVGADQQLHFRQLFKTVEMMGWSRSCGMVHVAHGLIRWKTGKFSTRKGDTIHLSDVIEKAIEKATEIAEKNKVNKEMSATEKEEMINAVAIGAVKFNDLSSDPRKDVIFDWDQIMSLDGDSGPYLQYTYARCKSVLDKTEIKEQKNIDQIPIEINKDEMALLKDFYRFEEKIIEAGERYSPAVIAEYLLNIARKYNEFYAKNRIINEKEEVLRIFLTKTTASILETGLWLLGIKTVEKM